MMSLDWASIFALAGVTKNHLLDRWEFSISREETDRSHDNVENKSISKVYSNEPVLIDAAKAVGLGRDDASQTNAFHFDNDIRLTPLIDSHNDAVHCKNNTAIIDQEESVVMSTNSNVKKRKKRLQKKSTKSSKAVSWGNIEEILFSRSVSVCSVPTEGAFPLGLGIELSRAYAQLSDLLVDSSGSGSSLLCSPITPRRTRRSDSIDSVYKFSNEADRIVLLQTHTKHGAETVNIGSSSANNLKHDSGLVTELNREVKSIAESRKVTGCLCKIIKADSQTSKIKLQNEIRAHGHAIGYSPSDDELNTASKADLLVKVKEIISQCRLCTESNCECVVNGIPCSPESCGCMQHGKGASHSQLCGNPITQPLYDRERVSLYRRHLLSSIGTTATTATTTTTTAAGQQEGDITDARTADNALSVSEHTNVENSQVGDLQTKSAVGSLESKIRRRSSSVESASCNSPSGKVPIQTTNNEKNNEAGSSNEHAGTRLEGSDISNNSTTAVLQQGANNSTQKRKKHAGGK
jgi:hypothetical protein